MVLGRVAERAAVDRLIHAAEERRSGALVLTGDAGIGKSTLLGYALDRARERGLAVLTARGFESESAISFAGLADLLRPVLPLLGTLPPPQARALESALSLGPPVPGDRFSVCAATIGMLAAAAEESPLLLVVDDLHWLDSSSREAVLFAARRLGAEGIALLAASRPVNGRGGDFAGVPTLRLEALSRAEADELLGRLLPASTAQLRRQLYDDAAGNPLGLQELAGQHLRRPTPHTTFAVPADSRLTRALGGRLEELPERTRAALLLAAAAGGAATDVVLQAARRSGLGLVDFAPAEEAGLLVIGEQRIEFRHPLLRSVLYGTASTHARARAHGALAEVLSGETGDAAADARAWHLAVARLPPDEETARLLDATALRARRRGGFLEAAQALEQAARFGSVDDRAVRLLRAARACQLSGRTGRIGPLLARALPLAADPQVRVRIRHVDAFVRMWRQAPLDGLTGMIEAADDVAGTDAVRAALMYADASIACFMLGQVREGLRLTTRGHELSRSGRPVDRMVTAVALAGALAMSGRRAEAAAHLSAVRQDLEAADPLTQGQEFGHAAYICLWLDQDATAAALAERLTSRARAVGAVGMLPQALAVSAELAFRAGRWGESLACADESVTLAVQSGQASLYSRHFLARMHGLQGRVAACMEEIERITATARRFGVECMGLYTGHTLGLAALAAGDLDGALRELETVRNLPMTRETPNQSVVPWAYDLVEAYVRCGRAADAEALLASVAPAPDDRTHGWQHAVVARCRGMLAGREEMLAHFRVALARHEGTGMPFERARTLLCLGERLRRDRQRAIARTYLRQALETFDALGATVWAGRARQELGATGETQPRPAAGTAAELTPQELQVAMVVARGATNTEAAAALFLSPKTIEYHLSNIYRKTRLRSRGELAVLATSAS